MLIFFIVKADYPCTPSAAQPARGRRSWRRSACPAARQAAVLRGAGAEGCPPPAPWSAAPTTPTRQRSQSGGRTARAPLWVGGCWGDGTRAAPACQCHLGHISRTPSLPIPPVPHRVLLYPFSHSFNTHERALCLSLYSILVYKLGFSVKKKFPVLSTWRI